MKVFSYLLLLILFSGCKKSDDSATTPDSGVNAIVLTPKQMSLPIGTYDAGTYGIFSVLVGNNIYLGSASNSGKPQFFVRYGIGSNSFSSALALSSNVCACGYSSHLISDGTNVFYIANDATKYTASSNTWATLTYPTMARDNNGEAGVGYYNGNIYFVGGRTASTLFKYYNISQDKWFTAPNYLYATNRNQIANYKDRLYVLGGEGTLRKMAYFSTTSNTWTALKDTPFDVNSSYDSIFTAILGDNLYLLQGDSIYVYDLINDIWATNPIKIDGLPSNSTYQANLFSNGQKLYIAGKGTSNVPYIFEITVSNK